MKILRMFLKHPQLLHLEGAEYINGELHQMTEKTRKEIFDLVGQARHVILHKPVVSKVYEQNSEDTKKFGKGTTNTFNRNDITHLPMAVPFKVTWMELFGEDGTIPMFYMQSSIGVAAIIGMLVNEVEPNVYDVFTMEAWQGEGAPGRMIPGARPGVNMTIYRGVVPDSIGSEDEAAVQIILRLWLKALDYGELGMQVTDEVIRVPHPTNPKKVKVHKISKIIRITSKKTKLQYQANGSRDIDWSHRWEVRGHWRKVGGIGKDRDGEYNVEGYTWVQTHVRGPDEAELVIKTRVKQ